MEAHIFPCNELCMHGKELRRLRIAAGLSERTLARKMSWYKKKVERYERAHQFCLHPAEMEQLVIVLGYDRQL
ncbi:MAG: helix-turn-helix domain-containing protein [Sedimentisphaerales bacterium]|nr:helix-turn-helix domain-containing protein [Sedimentisphaerales bacterium]